MSVFNLVILCAVESLRVSRCRNSFERIGTMEPQCQCPWPVMWRSENSHQGVRVDLFPVPQHGSMCSQWTHFCVLACHFMAAGLMPQCLTGSGRLFRVLVMPGVLKSSEQQQKLKENMQGLLYSVLSSLVASTHLYNFMYLHKLNKNKTPFYSREEIWPLNHPPLPSACDFRAMTIMLLVSASFSCV